MVGRLPSRIYQQFCAFWQHALPYDYCGLDASQRSPPIAETQADLVKIPLQMKQDHKLVILAILDSTAERMG